MITKEEFYNLYNKNSPQNKQRDEGPIDAKLFLRDISLPLAYYCAKKNVSPHFVTVLFLMISLTANVLFAIPSIYTLISLIILHEIGQLLDCVDGQLARYQGISSKFGENLDSLAHILISGSFMLAFGTRLYLANNQPLFLILGGIGAFSKAFEHQLIIDRQTLVNNQYFKKFYSNSRFKRYLVYLIESLITEVRLFAIALLILTFVQPFISKIGLADLSFIILILISFFENLLYRIYLSVKQLNIVQQKVWKGW